jgi:hypothetical protein
VPILVESGLLHLGGSLRGSSQLSFVVTLPRFAALSGLSSVRTDALRIQAGAMVPLELERDGKPVRTTLRLKRML